jgi:rhodanese-related sulfurtransferase/predicted transcriptional regulator
MTHTKQRLYDGFAIVGKALASGRRLEILDLLNQGNYTVGELAEELGLSTANTSSHLQVLAQAGLVTSHREGQNVSYALTRSDIVNLTALLESIASQELPEVSEAADRHLHAREGLAAVSAEEMARQLRRGRVVPVDARSAHDFRIGRLPGAQLAQVDGLAALGAAAGGKSVVVYCRGPFCSLADQVIRTLRSHNVEAARLEGGFSSWQAAGYPVEV